MKPSRRLVAAAENELDRISAERARADQRLSALDRERVALRATISQLGDQEQLLRAVLGSGNPIADLQGMVLTGRPMRIAAVRLLLEKHGDERPIDYKDWFALYGEAGFVVTGKRPIATFLTNIGRSPLIEHTTHTGTFLVRTSRVAEIEREHGEARAELADLMSVAAGDGDRAAELRRDRREITSRIGRIERNLAEARECLA